MPANPFEQAANGNNRQKSVPINADVAEKRAGASMTKTAALAAPETAL